MLAALRKLLRHPRPAHLGKYRMEWLTRVPQPTTRITDNVPRMPKRADFFIRSGYGDLGERQKKEVRRFTRKMPLNNAFGQVMGAITPLQRGSAREEPVEMPADLQERSNHLKSLCYFLDADIVGICRVPEYAWYSHDRGGTPIPARHQYAIVILVDQGYETMAGSSGDD
ncbi:MAG: hypothetical protein KDE34_17875, partial [Anaerolineales bacterium]|nr:hypothetical protein [Anaerolineales bacterium]